MPILKDDVIHHRFGLIDHSHAFRRRHGTHTSWPLVAVMLLMIGVLLVYSTIQVRAESVVVKAISNGPIPDQKSVILSPKHNDAFSTGSLPVSGTCQPRFFVRLYRNDIFSGSTRCTPGGTFSIMTDLFTGRNDLYVRTFNAANQEGPVSDSISVYLIESGLANDLEPFYINTEYFFKAAYSGQKINWDFDVFGGEGPFTAYATWGDGNTSMVNNFFQKSFKVDHIYETQTTDREYYSITIRIVDKNGRTAQLQLIAIMNDPHIISGALVRPNDPSPLNPAGWFNGALKGAWSAYGFILLMGVCFYLGERRGVSLGERLAARRLRRSRS